MTTQIERDRLEIDLDIEYPESDGEPMGETDVHVEALAELLLLLKRWFAEDPRVYVAGDNFLYYEKGNPKAVVSPDLYVVKGVEKKKRRIYQVWKEGKNPDVVIEISSRKTQHIDLGRKKDVYDTEIGVQEYYIFDPTGDYVKEQLRGWVRGPSGFVPATKTNGRISSRELGLDLEVRGQRLVFIDSATGEALPNLQESEVARQIEAVGRRKEAAARRKEAAARRKEAAARRKAEAALLKEEAARREEAAAREKEAAARRKEAAARRKAEAALLKEEAAREKEAAGRREAERALAKARAEMERMKGQRGA